MYCTTNFYNYKCCFSHILVGCVGFRYSRSIFCSEHTSSLYIESGSIEGVQVSWNRYAQNCVTRFYCWVCFLTLEFKVLWGLWLWYIAVVLRYIVASIMLNNFLCTLNADEHKNCKAVYLHVLASNISAIRFYEHRNFRLHTFLPYYYCIGDRSFDGYTYVLYLNGGEPAWTLKYPFCMCVLRLMVKEWRVVIGVVETQ